LIKFLIIQESVQSHQIDFFNNLIVKMSEIDDYILDTIKENKVLLKSIYTVYELEKYFNTLDNFVKDEETFYIIFELIIANFPEFKIVTSITENETYYINTKLNYGECYYLLKELQRIFEYVFIVTFDNFLKFELIR